MTSPTISSLHLSKFEKRPKMLPSTAFGKILVARRFAWPANWWTSCFGSVKCSLMTTFMLVADDIFVSLQHPLRHGSQRATCCTRSTEPVMVELSNRGARSLLLRLDYWLHLEMTRAAANQTRLRVSIVTTSRIWIVQFICETVS